MTLALVIVHKGCRRKKGTKSRILVIRPDYVDFSPPYYSASIPFVASLVVFRTLSGVPFIAVYEVNAQVGQPQVINNLTTAKVSSTVNNIK
jgi:hypothetical protein